MLNPIRFPVPSNFNVNVVLALDLDFFDRNFDRSLFLSFFFRSDNFL